MNKQDDQGSNPNRDRFDYTDRRFTGQKPPGEERYSGLIEKLEAARTLERGQATITAGKSGRNESGQLEGDVEISEPGKADEKVGGQKGKGTQWWLGIPIVLIMGLMGYLQSHPMVIAPPDGAKTVKVTDGAMQGDSILCIRYRLGCTTDGSLPTKTLATGVVLTYQGMPVAECKSWLQQMHQQRAKKVYWVDAKGQEVNYAPGDCDLGRAMKVKYN